MNVFYLCLSLFFLLCVIIVLLCCHFGIFPFYVSLALSIFVLLACVVMALLVTYSESVSEWASGDSVYREFARATLNKQVAIAIQARNTSNYEYVLYDRSFEAVDVKMVGTVRVMIDKEGRRGILSAGAQEHFDVNTYYYLLYNNEYFSQLRKLGEVVILVSR